MIPVVGKVYREPKSGLVVECVKEYNGVLFTGLVLSPGNLPAFHLVGSMASTLSAAAFELIGESKEEFLQAFAKYLNELPSLTTMDAALDSMGGKQ